MFDDFEAILRQDLSHIPTYRGMAQKLDRDLARLVTKYTELSIKVDNIESNPQVVTTGEALEKTITQAPKILWEQIRLAVKEAPEFANPFFLDKLKDVAFNDRTFTILQLKNGNIKIKLNLNETAGSLSDYGNAIKKVRQELGTHSGAEISSHFWSEKYYGAAREGKPANVKRGKGKDRKVVDQATKFAWKYWDTMRRRMAASGKVAPFWEILDKGTMPIPNAHRPGGEGTPYPTNDATDFTGKTIVQIKEFYNSQNVQTKANEGLDIVSAKKTLSELEEQISICSKMLEELSAKALDPSEQLILQLDDRIERADSTKVQKLEQALARQEQLPARIRLGGGVRIRTVRLQETYGIE